MIEVIRLTNFKCFRDIALELGTANVFAGVNGAGKSTVIQSLLVLRQSWESGSVAKGRLELSGPLADCGTVGEVYCADPSGTEISVVLNSTQGESLRLVCPQSELNARQYFLQIGEASFSEQSNLSSFGLFSEPFNYLHAERVGPRKAFQIPAGVGRSLSVGKYGEAAPFIVASESKGIPIGNDAIILQSSDGKEYRSLQFQWALWMARIFPGFDAESEIYVRSDQVRLGLALQRRQTGQPIFVRPTNTGFGISFVLGIVVAGLVAEPGTLLLVENPEAHLHPKAQSMIGEFLGRVAAGGTQVIVETHSEHVVNGLRRMVKQTILESKDLRLFFFSNGGELEPSVLPINVSTDGQFSAWPDGFFDQLDTDLNVILG